MIYEYLSTSSLRCLHEGYHRAIAADAAQPPHLRIYGVWHYPDWKTHGDAIEAVLTQRGVWFIPIGL